MKECFEDILDKNANNYIEWLCENRPEAYNDLNESNIEVIKAFKAAYPNAKGYKAHTGIVPIPEKVYNFCMEYVFDGNEDIIKRIEETQDAVEQLDILIEYGEQTDYKRGWLLTWS